MIIDYLFILSTDKTCLYQYTSQQVNMAMEKR